MAQQEKEEQSSKRYRGGRAWIRPAIACLDMLLLTMAGGIALLVRFNFDFATIPTQWQTQWLAILPVKLLLTVLCFAVLRMYRFIWNSVGLYDVARMIPTILGVNLLVGGVNRFLLGHSFPISISFLTLCLEIFLLTGLRCSFRIWCGWNRRRSSRQRGTESEERILLIGGGEAGRILVRELLQSERTNGKLCGIVDDDPNKWGLMLEGVRVWGGCDRLKELTHEKQITQLIVAIPTASPEEQKRILEECQKTGCKVRKLPGIYQMLNGEVNLSAVKDVQVEDLLGRAPVKLNQEALDGFLRDKIVLVTGGGGSIGSELCRQIVRYQPKRLILLDIYENNAYDIQQELVRQYGKSLDLRVEIASIRDKERIEEIFRFYRPQLVFHAAAHKHVPLMENCPAEAVKNNVFGTYHVVRAAEKYGVSRFVMISTDKAVNPTNFMGATKRFCEMILQSRTESTSTEFCAVRFGNVLGSNGSVVPLFRKQIADGGPVTVTDKRITRFFMTIPEAAQLVLEAGSMAKPGQIFVLDMGEPVKILNLAENMITLSGLRPYEDIAIEEIGLRPGEKLYEELLMKTENLTKTPNEKIFIEQQSHLAQETILDMLKRLDVAIREDIPNDALIDLMREMVPTYHAPEEVNEQVQEECTETEQLAVAH